MEEVAVEVTGRFYRAMSAGRSEIASTSSLYAEDAVRGQSPAYNSQSFCARPFFGFIAQACHFIAPPASSSIAIDE